jgi:hypothetical protein
LNRDVIIATSFVGQLDQFFASFLRGLFFHDFEKLLIAYQVGEAIGTEEENVIPLKREGTDEVEVCIPVDAQGFVNDIPLRMALGLLFA